MPPFCTVSHGINGAVRAEPEAGSCADENVFSDAPYQSIGVCVGGAVEAMKNCLRISSGIHTKDDTPLPTATATGGSVEIVPSHEQGRVGTCPGSEKEVIDDALGLGLCRLGCGNQQYAEKSGHQSAVEDADSCREKTGRAEAVLFQTIIFQTSIFPTSIRKGIPMARVHRLLQSWLISP